MKPGYADVSQDTRFGLSLILIAVSSSDTAFSNVGQIIGVVDVLRSEAVDNLDVSGWACSTGVTTPLEVTIFAGNPKAGGVELISVSANQESREAVSKACGVEGMFRFVAPVNSALLQKYAGQPIFAIAKSGSARSLLGGQPTFIPVDAGSVEHIAGIAGFNLLVDCSVKGGLYCASGLNPSANGVAGPPAYAYGASIVNTGGTYHMFYCSVGLAGGWDAVRSTSSADGIHWKTPVLKLITTGATNRDRSACDPSVVFFRGYYYLYYGSAYVSPSGNTQTVIQVARSASIDGTYQILAESGRWGASAQDPPAIIVKPAKDLAKSYGAGQPTMVVSGGDLWMWYTDDTYDYPHGNILMMKSSNPTVWSNPAVTNSHAVNVDVKWSRSSLQFVMFSVDPQSGNETVRVRFSKDGLTWSAPQVLPQMPNSPSAFFGQNVGVSGDPSGALAADRVLVTYMAPFVSQLNTAAGRDLTGKQTRPQWNLYGGFAPAP